MKDGDEPFRAALNYVPMLEPNESAELTEKGEKVFLDVPQTPVKPVDWPSREVVAWEIRRAMLDNPTDDSFNKRAEKREKIAGEYADAILARFAAALAAPVASCSEETAGLHALSERLLQLANDEGTAQIHDVAIQIAAISCRLDAPGTKLPRAHGALPRETQAAEVLEALDLAEDVLSRAPFSTGVWPRFPR